MPTSKPHPVYNTQGHRTLLECTNSQRDCLTATRLCLQVPEMTKKMEKRLAKGRAQAEAAKTQVAGQLRLNIKVGSALLLCPFHMKSLDVLTISVGCVDTLGMHRVHSQLQLQAFRTPAVQLPMPSRCTRLGPYTSAHCGAGN